MSAFLRRLSPAVSLALLVSVSFTGCETPGESALAGAATGAAIGGLLHGRGEDALKGAAIGAGAGYLRGRIAEDRRRDRYYDDYEDDRRSTYNRRYYRDRGDYPVARRTDRSGIVASPYPPHNLIDVRGIPRGGQVVDPSTGRVFINP